MAEVIPFTGILYNTAKVSGGDVAAPPYDIVTPEMREALYDKNPYNIIRIDSGRELIGDNDMENKYARASRYLGEWLAEGILVKSAKPCLYAYEMDYVVRGKRRKLRGFFGLVKLVELGKGVYPHEETHSKPKVDRLRLMTASEANTSPIFSLYNSPDKGASRVVERVAESKPHMEAEDLDGVVHRLWVIDGESDLAAIARDLSDKAVYIADGHHRYETALDYRNMLQKKSVDFTGSEPYNYVLMFLANIADEALTILPAHRIIRCGREDILDLVAQHFEVKTIPFDDDIIEAMKSRSQTLGFYQKGRDRQHLLIYRGDGLKDMHPSLKGLDVTLLHELILKDILKVCAVHYEMDPIKAKGMVTDGDFDAVFFLNPTKVEDVERVALSSMRMPPKSTYFYPKVMTGFIINSFKNSI
ncbi:MAG TPA: DUF1015 domain-containing protein [Thermodesulfovibrionales bacterium]|nr:DUF1015 domain-containing protein [Thermodesulfovibrionales bacterium]